MRHFNEILARSWRIQGSLLCVGLDPDAARLPAGLGRGLARIFAFNREIIDATAPWACAFKPQIAHYAAIGAEAQLQRSMDYIKAKYPHIPVILDAKRGDIGATAVMYAREAFARYGADAVTVNPYLGGDSLAPFLDYTDAHGGHKGVFILCRTSNPGSGDIQQLQSGGCSVAAHIASRAAEHWNAHGNVGLVAGATWPQDIAAIRSAVGTMPLLIPAVGAQGGDLDAALAAGLTATADGVLINVSRAIMYAAAGKDFAAAAAAAAEGFCRAINVSRQRYRDAASARQEAQDAWLKPSAAIKAPPMPPTQPHYPNGSGGYSIRPANAAAPPVIHDRPGAAERPAVEREGR